ncbi:flagellar motor switch protein FliN [Candidatus Haliotispira prima]|uniref:Flagellar motor switch protein FliN n=1 Tax=Candidatus Haliotispira prima TaxID=3034016 RepID=A0ABY8MG31_9SPIO|nr:flagellar motor switch protein FliN [Candidatus Haliotispira prima]
MGDNLSEDEINALLTPESDKLTPLLEDFLRVNRRTMPSFTETMGSLVSKTCTVSDPQVLLTSPSDILGRLPEELVEIQLNFRGAYSGSHSYYMDKTEAQLIANSMMGVDSEELDATALSAISEAFSQSVNAQLAFVEREFEEHISQGAPLDIQVIGKGSLALTPPVFTLLYDMNFDGEKALSIIEIINQDLAESIGKLLHQEEIVKSPGASKAGEAPKVEGVSFPSFRATEIGPQEEQNLGLLMDVPVTLAVELGRTKWQLRDVLTIGEGSIIELEKQAGEPVDVLVNNNLIARGEVVVVDENFSVRITEIITSFEQMMQKGM